MPEQAAVPLLWHSTCSILRFWFYLTEEILEKSLNLALIVAFHFFALYVRFACAIIYKIIRSVCIYALLLLLQMHATMKLQIFLIQKQTSYFIRRFLWIAENI